MGLMTFPNFLEKNCPYSVSSYFYRVEFQMRGAPHIHCLLWLEDQDGNPAPTFWTGESNENKCDINEKIKNIEHMASMLISASEDDIKCDEHQGMFEKNCTECYSVKNKFEKCPEHNNKDVTFDCPKCDEQKKLVQKFQIHHHTFTCKKKRKRITVKEKEGHGRFDEKKEGPKITNLTECRFNFPQFPMNKTKLILGVPKDLDPAELSKRKADLKKIKKFHRNIF